MARAVSAMPSPNSAFTIAVFPVSIWRGLPPADM